MCYALFLIFPMIIDFFLKIELQLLFFAVLVSSVQQKDIQYVLAVYFTCNSVYMLTMILAWTQTVYMEELCQWVEHEGKIVGNEFQIQIHGPENKRKICHWSSLKGDSVQHKQTIVMSLLL